MRSLGQLQGLNIDIARSGFLALFRDDSSAAGLTNKRYFYPRRTLPALYFVCGNAGRANTNPCFTRASDFYYQIHISPPCENRINLLNYCIQKTPHRPSPKGHPKYALALCTNSSSSTAAMNVLHLRQSRPRTCFLFSVGSMYL